MVETRRSIISSFLFLLISEGLNEIVKKEKTEVLLHGIEIGNRGLVVSLFQFANDTVIMDCGDSENLYMVKIVLRWFELTLGLRINFSKSCVYSFNVLDKWLKWTTSVLKCRVRSTPFVYLGSLVEGNLGTRRIQE